MVIKVKFVGSLRHASGVDDLTLECNDHASVETVVDEITKERPELKRNLIDQQVQDPRLNALVLLNGREISVLDGLGTKLKDGDKVVFIPVVHGG